MGRTRVSLDWTTTPITSALAPETMLVTRVPMPLAMAMRSTR
jgi:hypothetical protein